jgi:hypothetical protein
MQSEWVCSTLILYAPLLSQPIKGPVLDYQTAQFACVFDPQYMYRSIKVAYRPTGHWRLLPKPNYEYIFSSSCSPNLPFSRASSINSALKHLEIKSLSSFNKLDCWIPMCPGTQFNCMVYKEVCVINPIDFIKNTYSTPKLYTPLYDPAPLATQKGGIGRPMPGGLILWSIEYRSSNYNN